MLRVSVCLTYLKESFFFSRDNNTIQYNNTPHNTKTIIKKTIILFYQLKKTMFNIRKTVIPLNIRLSHTPVFFWGGILKTACLAIYL